MDWVPLSLLCALSLASADAATKAWLLNQEQTRLRDCRSWGAPLTAILHEDGSRMMLGVAFLCSLTSVMGKGAMRYMDGKHLGAFYFLLLAAASILLFAIPRTRILVRIWRRPWAVVAVSLLDGAMV